ncbi:MAG: YihY/virulence factor BrkB family protein [Bacteroidia bacterium]|nr:YihY/virulence factor BrkB family protein [Bacteroidia bacterium]MCZ2276422.1 YihY/virulence factor BrkB family protein [Bacteroidia bacterium]
MLKIIKFLPFIQSIIILTKRISPWGFDGASVYEVLHFFVQRMSQGEVQSRARSISFSFFLALFPAIIFVFSLIPYIPIDHFDDKLMQLLYDLLPPYTYEASKQTIEDIITRQRHGFVSLGFLFTFYISSNGVLSVIEAFNSGSEFKIKGFKLRMKSIWLTLFLSFLILTTIALIITSEVIIYFLTNSIELHSQIPVFLVITGKWILLLMLCFTAISCLYYFGTHKHEQFRFISPGSILTTFLIVITSLAFNYFIANFSQYNKIYGSIGTLIIILVWINFNCLQLIIGYELNTAIKKANRSPSKEIL